MGRPGIMLYFDILEPLRILTDAEKGKLLTAILEYGKEGKEPSFRGRMALTWGFVRPKIDRDEGSYDMAVLQRKYAAFCSRRSANGLAKIAFEDWKEMDEAQRTRLLRSDCGASREPTAVDDRIPTATATTATTTNTKTNTDTSVSAAADPDEEEDASLEAAAAAEKKKLKKLYGELGKGVVNLSDEQIEILLDKLGLDMFDHYVTKLADFIRENGASVKNHYVTILKWWTEDSTC